jgi:hypothetical protein
MEVAGGPGDRWLGHRKMAGREESPDTVLGSKEPKRKQPAALGPRGKGQRAW